MLNEFVIEYDKAVENRRTAEEDEDFQTMNTMPVLSSVHPIEAKAVKVYTRNLFEIFKKEWIEATNNLTHETICKGPELTTYRVRQLNIEKKYWRVVKFCHLDKVDVKCSCAMFETFGILCKHILYVMKKKNVESLLDHYILPRWKLDSRYKVSNGSIGLEEINNETGVSALTLRCVHGNYTKAIDQARDSPSEIKRLNTFLVKFLEDQMAHKKPTKHQDTNRESSGTISQVDAMPQMFVRDPTVATNTKGRPKNAKRIKYSIEVKKKKTCSYRKGSDHYITGCPVKKVDDSLLNKE